MYLTIGSIIIGIVDIRVAAMPTFVFSTAIRLNVIPKNGPRIVPIKVTPNADLSLLKTLYGFFFFFYINIIGRKIITGENTRINVATNPAMCPSSKANFANINPPA